MDALAGLLFIIIFIALLVWYISVVVDILKSDFKDSVNKIIWLLLVIFIPLLGCILYKSIGVNQKVTA